MFWKKTVFLNESVCGLVKIDYLNESLNGHFLKETITRGFLFGILANFMYCRYPSHTSQKSVQTQ